MSAHFKAVDRQTLYMFPPSVEDWLDQKHLARFIVEVVSKLDLHELKMAYSGGGSEAYHPEMLLSLLFYGYATGVFHSRKLEQATDDSIAFRYMAANTHPDHDTIATFRKRFLEQLKPLFLQILLLAKVLGFLKLGKISLDGSKIQANASKPSALSWGHAVELEQQLKEEVAQLMAMAAAADSEPLPRGWTFPPNWGSGTSDSRPLSKPRPSWRHEPPSDTGPSRPSTKPRKPNAKPKPRPAVGHREGPSRNRLNPACGPTTRST